MLTKIFLPYMLAFDFLGTIAGKNDLGSPFSPANLAILIEITFHGASIKATEL
jgi:hypothetical protein